MFEHSEQKQGAAAASSAAQTAFGDLSTLEEERDD
jgi:hypothetical protein